MVGPDDPVIDDSLCATCMSVPHDGNEDCLCSTCRAQGIPTRIVLSEKGLEQLADLLDAAPKPTEALRKLMDDPTA